MIENNSTEIDVDKLMVKIQKEATAGRNAGFDAGETEIIFNSQELMTALNLAEENVDAGSRIGSMTRFRKTSRWLAAFVGRIVIYLAQVITIKQRTFNHSILDALRLALDDIRNMKLAYQGLIDQKKQTDELMKVTSHLKTSLLSQEHHLSTFLEEARKRLPEPFSQEQLQTFSKAEAHLLDPLYVFFEDQFRGTSEEIKDRLKFYIPLVKKAEVLSEQHSILDIGCGRGEWLRLLKDEGLSALGLDINQTMVKQCLDLGLDVLEVDAIEYLCKVPDNTFGAVTGFHIIEHLPFERLIKMINETVRALKPGGVAIFETPNPENIIVGSCNFYADPTHKNPLFPPTVQFLMEQRGFVNVEILRHHWNKQENTFQFIEGENPLASKVNPLIEIARLHFEAASDFAVVGWKLK